MVLNPESPVKIPDWNGDYPVIAENGLHLGDIPLSKHAKVSHGEQKFNAESIRNIFLMGNCTPIHAQACSRGAVKISCQLEPKGSNACIGLIVGNLNHMNIVTGFLSTCDYWWSREDNTCTPPTGFNLLEPIFVP
jgi:hypothetical protein